jgi:hypothetical protein
VAYCLNNYATACPTNRILCLGILYSWDVYWEISPFQLSPHSRSRRQMRLIFASRATVSVLFPGQRRGGLWFPRSTIFRVLTRRFVEVVVSIFRLEVQRKRESWRLRQAKPYDEYICSSCGTRMKAIAWVRQRYPLGRALIELQTIGIMPSSGMWRHADHVSIDVSEECITVIIKAIRISELGTTLAVTINWSTQFVLRSVLRLLVIANVPS